MAGTTVRVLRALWKSRRPDPTPPKPEPVKPEPSPVQIRFREAEAVIEILKADLRDAHDRLNKLSRFERFTATERPMVEFAEGWNQCLSDMREVINSPSPSRRVVR